MRRKMVSAVVVLFAFTTCAALADWPQWRGPRRDGVSDEKGLLKTWPSDGPPLAWKTRGLGQGYSSVAIAQGKIFTMGKRRGEEFVIALSDTDGTELWATKVGKPWGDGPRCTPTIDGELLYAVGPNGDLLCLETASGQELWRKSFVDDFGGKAPTWGFCESPLVDGEKLIVTPHSRDATMVALNNKTGEVIWKCAIPAFGGKGNDNAGGYSSIVISEATGVKQYVQLLGRGVVGVAAKDGKFLWGYDKVANGTASIPTPIVDGDFVFASSGYGTGSALLRLSKSGNNVQAREVFFLNGNVFQNHHGGMIRIGQYIYAGHGHNNGFPICIDTKTGRVAWGGQRGPGKESAAVAYADGQLYFRYQDGTMALIEASPRAYKLNGSFQIPDVRNPSWAHPVVSSGKLYLREQDQLFVYDVSAK